MRLPAASAPALPNPGGFPVARTAQQPFTSGVTAKMSVNFNANNVRYYGTQLPKVSPGIQTCTLLTGSRILDTVLEMAMMTLDLAAVPFNYFHSMPFQT